MKFINALDNRIPDEGDMLAKLCNKTRKHFFVM